MKIPARAHALLVSARDYIEANEQAFSGKGADCELLQEIQRYLTCLRVYARTGALHGRRCPACRRHAVVPDPGRRPEGACAYCGTPVPDVRRCSRRPEARARTKAY